MPRPSPVQGASAFALGLSLLSAQVAAAQPCPTRASWPTTDWPVQLVDRATKAEALDALEAYAFTLQGKDSERLGFRTDGLVIIKRGVIVYERYARGYDVTKKHLSWSVAKSLTSALVGVAVKEGVLSLSDSICQHLPEYEGSPRCDITVKDAITFGTGLSWLEVYENQSYQVSPTIAMLYGVARADNLAHILSHKAIAAPGARWQYSTADAQLASAVAKRALAKKYDRDAFWTLLFDRIGLSALVIEEDAKGTPQGGSSMYATPRDFAKFGFLFLNDGCWNGERLLPEGWVAASTTPSDVYVATLPAEPRPSGYAWWLNRPLPAKGRPAPWPDVPEDAYAASGHWGQRIVVVPSEDVVMVRFGDDRKGAIDANTLIKLSLAVAR
ncbi:MAG: serine hydrolase [Myxococcus sp.]|nr:serine hydrolase [Myxococcus sp.]